jgi:hypothetical protein
MDKSEVCEGGQVVKRADPKFKGRQPKCYIKKASAVTFDS